MTSKEVKKYLLRISEIDTRIENKSSELARYKESTFELATSTTQATDGERVQSSGSKHKMADAIDRCVDYERKVVKFIAEQTEERANIIETIDLLPNKYSDILHKVYVQGRQLKSLVNSKTSYSTITTNHGIALKMLSDILEDENATKCN